MEEIGCVVAGVILVTLIVLSALGITTLIHNPKNELLAAFRIDGKHCIITILPDKSKRQICYILKTIEEKEVK